MAHPHLSHAVKPISAMKHSHHTESLGHHTIAHHPLRRQERQVAHWCPEIDWTDCFGLASPRSSTRAIAMAATNAHPADGARSGAALETRIALPDGILE